MTDLPTGCWQNLSPSLVAVVAVNTTHGMHWMHVHHMCPLHSIHTRNEWFRGPLIAVRGGLSLTKFDLALFTICRGRAGQQSALGVKHSPGVQSGKVKVQTTLCTKVTDPAALLLSWVTA